MRKSFQLVTLTILLLVLQSTAFVMAGRPNKPPRVTIDVPANGSTVSGIVTISVAVHDKEDKPDPLPDISINGNYIATANTYDWNTASVTDGTYTINAEATDSGGLPGYDSVIFTVQNVVTPPPLPNTLTSIAWFGFETGNLVAHGLWARGYRSMLDQMWSLGFNSLRLPFCNEMVHSTKAISVNQQLGYNYELDGLTPLEAFDKIIDYAYRKGFAIMLDRHCTSGSNYPELWYDSAYSDEDWIKDWEFLVDRYGSKIWGCDLANEPHGKSTWGSNDFATDWRWAAERCGRAILNINPNAYIIVEGIQYYNGDATWWGGNLMGVRIYPVRLDNVIYSPHDYGPDLYRHQPWFKDPNFPLNLPDIWDKYWGYIEKENFGRLWIGEFGTDDISADTKQGQWYNTLLNYMKTNDIEFCYWAFNANEGNRYGILEKRDWSTVDQGTDTAKWDSLKPYLQGDTNNPILYADP